MLQVCLKAGVQLTLACCDAIAVQPQLTGTQAGYWVAEADILRLNHLQQQELTCLDFGSAAHNMLMHDTRISVKQIYNMAPLSPTGSPELDTR